MNVFEMLITTPLGYILSTIYNFVQSYGWAVVIFTIITKLILIPLTVKQQKSMSKMQRVKPLMDYIQEKYKDDPTRLNQETMKIYKEFGVSPTGGCLPLLIQFPIIIGLYQVIQRPLSFIYHLSAEEVSKIMNMYGANVKNAAQQIAVCRELDPAAVFEKLNITVEKINFNFLGLDLSYNPSLSYLNWYWIIPILAAATAYLSSYIMRKIQGTPQQQEGTMKTMNMLMPLMSAYFCFILPAGVGVYWIVGNIVQIVQSVLLDVYYKSKNQEDEIDVDEYFKKDRSNRKKHK